MKQDILKLNSGFFPIAVTSWKTAMTDIVSGSVHPIDVYYETGEDGKPDKNKIESFNVIRSFDEWSELPIREVDEFVHTAKRVYRIPPIVVCAKFNKIIQKRVFFPTKHNIWRRDQYVCQYTGKHLTKEDVSVDHIMPVSRGGQNTWENLVTCDKDVNVRKADRTPEECGLKLRNKPVRPSSKGTMFSFMRKEWEMFVDSGSYE